MFLIRCIFLCVCGGAYSCVFVSLMSLFAIAISSSGSNAHLQSPFICAMEAQSFATAAGGAAGEEEASGCCEMEHEDTAGSADTSSGSIFFSK